MDIGSGVAGLIKSGLRSIAASVSVAASISQAWDEYESHLQSKKIEQFFQLLQPEIASVKECIKHFPVPLMSAVVPAAGR